MSDSSGLSFVGEVFDGFGSVGDVELSVEVGFGVEVVFFRLVCDVEFDYTFLVEDVFVDSVGTPLAVFLCLLPIDADDGVVGVGGVAEIVLDVGFVVGERPSPDEGVW